MISAHSVSSINAKKSSATSISSPQNSNNNNQQKINHQTRIIEKLISDLEDLCKTLVDKCKTEQNYITDDTIELQKFCSKFEYLLQFKLKEKKNILNTNTNKNDYWSLFVSLFSNNRGFEDAIKYVKNLNEIKTNVGRGRAFIRFCLQYHRLADAIQQITLDEKIINNWYSDGTVWLNNNYKDKIIQLLYDFNDVNFDILSKSCFELDTSWPTLLTTNTLPMNITNRHRTLSHTSLSSVNTENTEHMLSSTPLEMDDEIFNKITNVHNKNETTRSDDDNLSMNFLHNLQIKRLDEENLDQEKDNKQASMTTHDENYYNTIIESYTKQLNEHKEKLNELEGCLNKTREENEHLNELKTENKNLAEQINELKKGLNDLNDSKSQIEKLNNRISELESLTNNSANLNETSLKEYQDKYNVLEESLDKSKESLKKMSSENDVLKQEINSLKFELSAKQLHEENLIKDAISQSQSITILKDMCTQQENTIRQLKSNLDLIKSERQTEIDIQLFELREIKALLKLRQDENLLLNEQVLKLTKSLEEEKNRNKLLNDQINNSKKNYENELTQKSDLINQLELDNNEIKKRLVKLIKEKAQLWEKADNLEYENLLKTNAMWHDDANVHNCMSCNSTFSILLRKHHCRICLKIYCYYCCNNWIEYNNSKVRVCKKCYDTQEILSKSSIYSIKDKLNSTSNNDSTSEHEGGDQISNNFATNNNDNDDDVAADNDDDDDDDPDINFEVRPEKLITQSDNNNDAATSTNNISTTTTTTTNNNKNNNSNNIVITPKDYDINKRNRKPQERQQQEKQQESEYFIPDNAVDDLDTFAIVSKDELNKVIH